MMKVATAIALLQLTTTTTALRVPFLTPPSSCALSATAASASAQPIDPSGWPDRFPAKDHCSRCGLCETSYVSHVAEACAFLGDGMARMDGMEEQVHGRRRSVSDMVWNADKKEESLAEEARFGVLHEPVQLARGIGIENAQWTGCVTAIALTLLEQGVVDAVVCIANGDEGWSSSEPILAKTPEDVLRGRGVKPALAPSLQVLDKIKADSSIRKLLFCGVGCAVQAFRAVEQELGLEEVYVMGTNCVDNSPTADAAKDFITNGVKIDEDAGIRGYEFMQDFRVHVKTDDAYIKKPYFVLPGTIAEASIATSCLACFDYTNGLADVVVGYMGAPLDGSDRMDKAFQTVTMRNAKGASMVQTAIENQRLELFGAATGTGAHEKISSATVTSDSIVLKMVGGKVQEQGMPGFVGEVMATVMRAVGPKGINFARYSIDYHILRNYLHVVQEWGPERAKRHLPQYSMDIVEHYMETDTTFAELCIKVTPTSR